VNSLIVGQSATCHLGGDGDEDGDEDRVPKLELEDAPPCGSEGLPDRPSDACDTDGVGPSACQVLITL
jgi:hypothetical protein